MGFRLEASTVAKCRPEHVWQKFEKVEQWAWWNRVVAQARWVNGQPWQKGSVFFMEIVKPKNFKVKPVVLEAAAPNKVGWVGTSFGFRGEHWFTFEPQPDGTTLLKTWEDVSGFATAFFSADFKQGLTRMHQEWLDLLKAEAEKIAREELARA